MRPSSYWATRATGESRPFLSRRNLAHSAGGRAKEYRKLALELHERTVPGLRPNEAFHRLKILFPTAVEKVLREVVKVRCNARRAGSYASRCRRTRKPLCSACCCSDTPCGLCRAQRSLTPS